ncbi:MAG: FAD binding domain-containing protein [Flavobacteriaceae bacterium]|nr:FAD binding domain-containing protein [Flavobacteriaceae bacterium]
MIQFILNDTLINTQVNSGLTLLDFIRDYEGLKGSKIGCREGDCGACTVLVGTLANGKVSYQNITSCISPIGNANGKHIVTIEGINLKKNLNTAQKAMHDNYATQCGFCTPGFVVSLTGYALNYSKKNKNTCNDAIGGNICRCTGYKSIEKASDLIEKNLMLLNPNDKIKWLAENNFIPDYFNDIPQKLIQLKPVELGNNGQIVANGTDLYVNRSDELSEENVNLILHDKTLKGIDFNNGICTLGSNTTATEINDNSKLNAVFPDLKKYLKLISSQPIRNMGTLGGNFVNASPIGDMTIFFLALNSKLTLVNINGSKRKISLQDFHKGYKIMDLQNNELIAAISFELPGSDTFFNFEKVSKRKHLDIASVNTACMVKMDKSKIKTMYLSIGGVAAIPKYLNETSSYLQGKELNANNIISAEKILQKEISPISDVRGSSIYKRLLARQLFFSHFLEMFPDTIKFHSLIS